MYVYGQQFILNGKKNVSFSWPSSLIFYTHKLFFHIANFEFQRFWPKRIGKNLLCMYGSYKIKSHEAARYYYYYEHHPSNTVFFSREKSPDKNTINFVFIKSYKSTCLFCPFFSFPPLLSLSFNSTCKRDQMDSQKKSMWIFVTKRAFTITFVIFHTDILYIRNTVFASWKCNELLNLLPKFKFKFLHFLISLIQWLLRFFHLIYNFNRNLKKKFQFTEKKQQHNKIRICYILYFIQKIWHTKSLKQI